HRKPGHDFELGRGSTHFPAAHDASRDRTEPSHPYGPGRTVHADSETRRPQQFHGPDHRSQPNRRYRTDSGARSPRPWPDRGHRRGVGMDPDTALGGIGDRFPSTQLSLLAAASTGGPPAVEALERLSALYWKPVYKFVRAKFRKSNEDAKDLTQ